MVGTVWKRFKERDGHLFLLVVAEGVKGVPRGRLWRWIPLDGGISPGVREWYETTFVENCERIA
jgi:hypothetical protein